MKLLDLIIYYLGIYGIAWSILYAKPMQPIINIFRNINTSMKNLLECIVCTSFWVGLPFLFLYFNTELWFTKILIHFSTLSFVWIVANILED